MLVPKMFLHAALKFVLPEVVKLIKPLQDYKDKPNDADLAILELKKDIGSIKDAIKKLQKNSHPRDKIVDWTDEIASVASVVSQDSKKIDKLEQEISRVDELSIKWLKLDAMMGKFDRDQDYLESQMGQVKNLLKKIVEGK